MLAESVSIIALRVDITFIGFFASQIVKKRRPRIVAETKTSCKIPLILLASIAWTLTFWSHPLLISNGEHNFIYELYISLLPFPGHYFLLIGWIGPFVVGSVILRKLMDHKRD